MQAWVWQKWVSECERQKKALFTNDNCIWHWHSLNPIHGELFFHRGKYRCLGEGEKTTIFHSSHLSSLWNSLLVSFWVDENQKRSWLTWPTCMLMIECQQERKSMLFTHFNLKWSDDIAFLASKETALHCTSFAARNLELTRHTSVVQQQQKRADCIRIQANRWPAPKSSA